MNLRQIGAAIERADERLRDAKALHRGATILDGLKAGHADMGVSVDHPVSPSWRQRSGR